jgi:hypothetical protein
MMRAPRDVAGARIRESSDPGFSAQGVCGRARMALWWLQIFSLALPFTCSCSIVTELYELPQFVPSDAHALRTTDLEASRVVLSCYATAGHTSLRFAFFRAGTRICFLI